MQNANEDSTTPAPRLDFIDGLRGVAVMMVVFFHAALWGGLPVEGTVKHYLYGVELGRLRRVLSLGGVGVDIFLAVSGFCLFWPLVRGGAVKKLDVREFWKRRIRRIAPPYYFAFALVIGVSYLTFLFQGESWWPWRPNSFQNAFPWRGADEWANVAAHLLLIHGFFNDYISSFEGAFWSLSLEWQFYFLFVPLALVARRFGAAWAVATPFVVTALFRLFGEAFAPQFLNTTVGGAFALNRWVEFGAGMLAAALLGGAVKIPALPVRSLVKNFGVLALFAVAFALEYSGASMTLRPTLWGVACCALILCAAQNGSAWQRIFAWKPLVEIGTISYSLYLVHGAVYMAMAMLLSRTAISRDARQTLYLLAGPILAVGFAALFFQICEKPFLSSARTRRQNGIAADDTSTIRDKAMP